MTVTIPDAPEAPVGYKLPVIVQEDAHVADTLRLIGLETPVIAFDVETTGLEAATETLLLLQMSNGRETAVFDMTTLTQTGWDAIATYMSKPEYLWIAHNAKFDYGWLAAKLQNEELTPRLFDTMLAEQLLIGGAEHGGNSLAALCKRYLGIDLDKSIRVAFIDKQRNPKTFRYDFSDAELQYAAVDAWVLPAIFSKQAAKLGKYGLADIARVEFGLVKAVSRMERRGVLIDKDLWTMEVAGAKATCTELEERMKKDVGRKDPKTGELAFNPGSHVQVKEALYEYGIVVASTNRVTLEKVGHPLAKTILEWRKVAVLRDRYGDSWLGRLDGDDRVHAQFVQMGASTGRFSSRDPNLQQLPRGELLRKCFIAGPGRKLVTADYSQIEIRILAELSEDANMITIFESGLDIHSATAQQMFKLDELPAKDSKHRQLAKSVNFGLMYGAGASNLQRQLAAQEVPVSLPEAERLIKLYFDQFPQAKRWLDAQSRRAYAAIDDGFDVVTVTLGGRKRVFKVHASMRPYDRGHIARQTRNTPIQGGSADITKQAMVKIDDEFQSHPEWEAHLLMTVHDEVVCEVLDEYVDVVAKMINDKMIEGAQAYMSKCPIKVDVSIGDCWSK